jgi:signal transduction histidine kinase
MVNSYTPPIARMAEDRIRNQVREIDLARSSGRVQHGRDELVMIVNEARQIVYTSPALVSTFCGPEEERPRGKRPGEALGCVHAGLDQCGHTENCEFCGAAEAILDAQAGLPDGNKECVIQTGGGDHTATFNFSVRTFPLELGADRFVMLLLDDISREKHRVALERIFFHDILNTVTGLSSYLGLLERQVVSGPDKELVVRIGEITGMLVDEIKSQKLLASAENGTLSVARQFVVSRGLIESIMIQYAEHDLTRGRHLVVEPFCESLSFVSDETILRRVLGNMVKNALEACGPGETVALGCRQVGSDAVLHVRNPGVVPREIRFQIFNRFFSTKGNGRGLGTYSMKLLAERYLGGQVWFTSDDQDGTVFSVSIPLDADTVE